MSRRRWLIFGVLVLLAGVGLGLAWIAGYAEQLNLWWKTPPVAVLFRLDVDFEGFGPGGLELGDEMDLLGRVVTPKGAKYRVLVERVKIVAMRPKYFQEITLVAYVRNWWESMDGQRAWPAVTIWVAVTPEQKVQLEAATKNGPINPVRRKAGPKDSFVVPEVPFPEPTEP